MEKKKPIKSLMAKLSGIAAVGITIGGLIFFNHSWADQQDDAAFTCSSAINVMDCIKQTGTAAPAQPANLTSIPINSQALGFTGPVSVGLRYDNYLAWILDVGYAQSYKDAAAAFKLSAGLNERRANVTLGYSITPKQQIKLTYEYLSQNLPFDYTSGTVNQWVSQNALGGAYQYMLNNGILRALEVYGNYTKAQSKDLSTTEMYTDNVLTQLDYRRIAGGAQENTGVNVTLTPLKGTILKVGAGYSSLSFDTKWEDNEANAVLAYNADISQLLTPTLLVSGGIGTTASGSTYTAKVSKILPWSLEAALIGQYTATTNDIPGASTVTASLSYPAPKTYTNMFAAGLSNLKNWVQQPVIYNTRVLAKAEEKLVQVKISAPATLPAQNVAVGNEITPIYTKDYFSFDPEAYNKIDYTIVSLTQKGEVNNTFSPSALNLQLTSTDSYNAKLYSTGQMPANSMTPGNYTLTIGATGYYAGQPIPPQTNTAVDITVTGNTSLNAPTWNTTAQLPPATAGVVYPSTNLSALVKDNSGLTQGDSYTFKLVSVSQPAGSPQWLMISQDGKYLVGVPNTPVPNNAYNPTQIILNGQSTVSGKDIVIAGQTSKDGAYSLVVNAAGKNPTWVAATNNLPDAVYSTPYLTGANGTDPVTLKSYISNTGMSDNNLNTLTFSCNACAPDPNNSKLQLLPLDGLELNTSTGDITGKPTNPNQINATIPAFTVTATNTATLASDSQFIIKLSANTALGKPTWITVNSQPKPLNKAYTSAISAATYNEVLTDYIAPPAGAPSSGDLSFAVNAGTSSNNCSWASLDSDGVHLVGKTIPDASKGVCQVAEIDASSKASGQTAQFKDSSTNSITVVGAISPTSTALASPLYQQPYSVNLNNGYFTDGDPNDKFTFSIVSSASLSGLSIADGQTLAGTPNQINDVSNTSAQLVLKVTSQDTNVPALTYTVPNFVVQPNPSLKFTASWNDNVAIPPAIANQDYSGRFINIGSYFTPKTTQNDGTPVTDSISNYAIKITSSNCTWLAIDAKLGNLQSTRSPAIGEDCTFNLTVTSKATNSVVTLAGSQTITVATGPQWTTTVLPATWYYYGNNPAPITVDNTWLTPLYDTSISTIGQYTVQTNPAPSWLTVTSHTSYATISSNVSQDSAISQVQTPDKCNQDTTKSQPVASNPMLGFLATDSAGGATTQNFVACLLPNKNLILSANFNTSQLPPAKKGQLYSVNIDPYNGSPGYLDKTKTQSGDPVKDILTYTMQRSTSGTSCDDVGFSINANTGVITNNAVTSTNDCNFILQIYSTATDTVKTYAQSTIKAAVYTLPTWVQNQNLPSATNGLVYSVSIDPPGGTYLTQTLYGGDPVTTDTNTYALTYPAGAQNAPTDNCTWLTVSQNGTLSGKPLGSQNASCSAYITLTATHQDKSSDQDILAAKPINITGGGVVTWAPGSPPQIINYSTDTPDANGYYHLPTANLITSPSASMVSFSVPTIVNQLTNGDISPSNSTNNYVAVKPTTEDVTNNPNYSPSLLGSFNITATPNNGIPSTTSVPFNVQITGTLTNPTLNNNSSINFDATQTSGQNSDIDINPYDSSTFMTQTQVTKPDGTKASITDTITFIPALSPPSDSCSYASINSKGVIHIDLSQGTLQQRCVVYFSVSSAKNSPAGNTPVNIAINLTAAAPQFTIPSNLSIQFDDIGSNINNGNNTTINLNSMVGANAQTPDLKFLFSQGNPNQSGNWQIITNGSKNGVTQYYLARRINNNTFDAANIYKAESVPPITASNFMGSSAPGSLNVTINPSPHVQVKWIGQSTLTFPSNNPSSGQCYYEIYPSYLQSYSGDTPIINDVLQMAYKSGGGAATAPQDAPSNMNNINDIYPFWLTKTPSNTPTSTDYLTGAKPSYMGGGTNNSSYAIVSQYQMTPTTNTNYTVNLGIMDLTAKSYRPDGSTVAKNYFFNTNNNDPNTYYQINGNKFYLYFPTGISINIDNSPNALCPPGSNP